MGCGSSNTDRDTKEARVIFIGLDGAGKTTLLYRLKMDEEVTTIPTVGFNIETIHGPGPWSQPITVWDIGGGQDGVQTLLKRFYDDILSMLSVVVLVVDSVDTERLGEARDGLMEKLLENGDLRGTPLLVLANKADLPEAVAVDDIAEKLHLKKLSKKNYCEILPVSGKTGQGVDGVTSTILRLKAKKRRPMKKPVSEQKQASRSSSSSSHHDSR